MRPPLRYTRKSVGVPRAARKLAFTGGHRRRRPRSFPAEEPRTAKAAVRATLLGVDLGQDLVASLTVQHQAVSTAGFRTTPAVGAPPLLV
jgi:hypothetical protein